ncbi:MAG TPA: hypothetical protein VJY34_01810 [Roseiarcus sp.]|nr:hypothetical protein [Roseiarcus sp.]
MRCSHSEKGSGGTRKAACCFPVTAELFPCSAQKSSLFGGKQENRESARNILESFIFFEGCSSFWGRKTRNFLFFSINREKHRRSSPNAFGEPCAKGGASRPGCGSGRPGLAAPVSFAGAVRNDLTNAGYGQT